ncbi:hypothetical protein F5Y06DRAFT_269337 [Hypoxylon sp. FL0890]|nr:hypothetical protein F5Y06DRAFT_269337 [Hypoxylon sp. FL0890]
MFSFYLGQFFDQFEKADEDSDTTSASSYEPVLCPCANCPANLCQCSGPRSPSGPGNAENSAAVIADLNEQLRKARLQIESLEREVKSNSEAAERIVGGLLRRIYPLRNALAHSEERRKSEAAKHKQASERVHALVNKPRENNPGSKYQDLCRQELALALEESEKAAAEAIQNAEARDREVAALRDEFMMAEKIISDERSLSHVISQQVEGMERILNIQHAEIKEQKATIADLNQVIKVLHAENDDLMAKEASARETSYVDRGIGGEMPEAKGDEVTKLERRIAELEEERVSLQIQLEQERDTQTAMRDYDTTLKGKLAAALFSINKCELDIATLIATTSNPANGDNRPPLEAHVNSQTPAIATPQDQLEELKQKNRDLEKELQELRHVGAKLTGFHPLKRVKAHSPLQTRIPRPAGLMSSAALTSFPPLVRVNAHGSLPEPPPATPMVIKTSLLHLPEGYEDIPELRLPSPIASIKSKSQSQNQSPTELRLNFGSGKGRDGH